MATITTKYDIGDTVWYANITTETKQHDCPDCLGSREWSCTSPAGGTFPVPCPRCSAQYQSSDALNLKYSVWTPTARRLTIGSVRVDTSDEGHQYMCRETGVGSGSIYRENTLFETEAEALASASAKAAANNADATGWVAKQYDKTVKLSDYQLKDAEMEAAKSRSSSALRAVSYLLEDLDEAVTLDDVRASLAAWREKQEEA